MLEQSSRRLFFVKLIRMYIMFKQHRLSKLTLAVGLGLFVHTNGLIAAEAELAANDEIEEVVAVGTRLQ